MDYLKSNLLFSPIRGGIETLSSPNCSTEENICLPGFPTSIINAGVINLLMGIVHIFANVYLCYSVSIISFLQISSRPTLQVPFISIHFSFIHFITSSYYSGLGKIIWLTNTEFKSCAWFRLTLCTVSGMSEA